jgi:multidrug resistance efflux pump
MRSHAGDGNAGRAAGSKGPSSELRPTAVGQVDTEQGVKSLYPLLPGLVVHVEAHENDEVEEGAPLFYLDDKLAQFQVQEAEDDLKAAEEQLAKAEEGRALQRAKLEGQRAVIVAKEHQLKGARSKFEEAKRLNENKNLKMVSDETLSSASEIVASLEATIAAEKANLRGIETMNPEHDITLARLNVEAKRAQQKKALYALRHCTMWAPCKGTVLRILVSAGEVLPSTPRQPAVWFCPSGPRIVRAEVEQEFARFVTVGQSAVIQDDSTGTGSWRGRVKRLSDWYTQRRSIFPEPLQLNDVRTLEAIIEIDPNQPHLRIGQRVRVRIDGTGG